MIETHNGSEQVIKQHVWGTQYVDELLQIAINGDPGTDNDCVDGNEDESYWVCQDANYNVTDVFESDGDLKERYTYTPYGRRSVFKPADSSDTFGTVPIAYSQPVQLSSQDQPYGICDPPTPRLRRAGIGHQGLMHDKEFGLIYNRARYLHPVLGRFTSRDPLGYADGMSLYEYVGSAPVDSLDPTGEIVAVGFGAALLAKRSLRNGIWEWMRNPDTIREDINKVAGALGLDKAVLADDYDLIITTASEWGSSEMNKGLRFYLNKNPQTKWSHISTDSKRAASVRAFTDAIIARSREVAKAKKVQEGEKFKIKILIIGHGSSNEGPEISSEKMSHGIIPNARTFAPGWRPTDVRRGLKAGKARGGLLTLKGYVREMHFLNCRIAGSPRGRAMLDVVAEDLRTRIVAGSRILDVAIGVNGEGGAEIEVSPAYKWTDWRFYGLFVYTTTGRAKKVPK